MCCKISSGQLQVQKCQCFVGYPDDSEYVYSGTYRMDAVAATEDACGMARPWSLGLDKYTGIADENTTTTKKKN